jgi:hypothetical protein
MLILILILTLARPMSNEDKRLNYIFGHENCFFYIKAFEEVSLIASCTAAITIACTFLCAATTPLLPRRVRPSEKSSGSPFISDTIPPASVTNRDPEE